MVHWLSESPLVLNSGSVLGNPWFFEGWFALKRNLPFAPNKSLSNAVYCNSSEFGDDVTSPPAQDLRETFCIGDAAFKMN